ncbi:MAG: hypothetical protein LC790_00490 [Actinobacteria bacterium]|nr:hypothetical protein [Actinomycetota bacterium]MCA1697448.1 hypothetical protein [Actinomycetota bacterium]
MQEEVEISTYLQGVTLATSRRRAREARVFAEALGAEAEHRVLARFARATILGTTATEIPNNRGFEAFKQRTPSSALAASAKLGIGFGKRGATPGAFYESPGDPRKTGTGHRFSHPARPSRSTARRGDALAQPSTMRDRAAVRCRATDIRLLCCCCRGRSSDVVAA